MRASPSPPGASPASSACAPPTSSGCWVALIRGILLPRQPHLHALLHQLHHCAGARGGPSPPHWRWLPIRRCALTSIRHRRRAALVQLLLPWSVPSATLTADHPGQSPHQPSPACVQTSHQPGNRSGGWPRPDRARRSSPAGHRSRPSTPARRGALTLLWLASGQSLGSPAGGGLWPPCPAKRAAAHQPSSEVRGSQTAGRRPVGGQRLPILMIPAVVLSTGLFILFMPFTDVFARPGPLAGGAGQRPDGAAYVLRTSAPCNWWCASTMRLADSLGCGSASPAPGASGPLLRRLLAQAALDDPVPRISGAIAMFGKARPSPPCPWLLYQQLGSYRLTEAAATAPCCSPLLLPVLAGGAGLGGRHVGSHPRRHCRLPAPRIRPGTPPGAPGASCPSIFLTCCSIKRQRNMLNN